MSSALLFVRWLAVLPVAAAAFYIAPLLWIIMDALTLQGSHDWQVEWPASIVMGIAPVYFGMMVAPSGKRWVGGLLALVIVAGSTITFLNHLFTNSALTQKLWDEFCIISGAGGAIGSLAANWSPSER